LFGVAAFHTLAPTHPPMVPLTAVTVVGAGVSLWLVGSGTSADRGRMVGRLVAGLVVVVGALILSEYLFDVDLGIDQLPCRTTVSPSLTQIPGRPSPEDAVAFVLVGLALLWLDARSPRLQWMAQASVLLAAAGALIALIGYAYEVESLYGRPELLPYTGMSLFTALTVVALALGLACAHPNWGLLGVVTGDGFGNLSARRLLPVVIVIPLLLGFLVVVGERQGLYGSPFTLALLTVA